MNYKAVLNLSAVLLLHAALVTACNTSPPGQSVVGPVTPEREARRLQSLLPHTVVLDYDDFGPHVVAYELIGHDWNQWKEEGHASPDGVGVKVVVYRGVSLDSVKDAYPVIIGKSDHRYVEYERALSFLEAQIKRLEDDKKNGLEADLVKFWDVIIATLKNTRAAIIAGLT